MKCWAEAVLLYDAECGLCSRAVRFVLGHERRRTLRFAPLAGASARRVLERHPELKGVDSIVWVERDVEGIPVRVHTRSAAVLCLLEYLGSPWSLLLVARVIPSGIRDRIYDFIARNRHRVLRHRRCPVMPADARARFLPGWAAGCLLAAILGGVGPVRAEDTTPEMRSRFFPLPILFYQPETKWGGGVGLLHTYRAALDARTSSNGLIFLITSRKQFVTAISAERFTTGNRWRLGGEARWSRFPGDFYGIGNDTDLDAAEAYTPQQAGITVDIRRAIRPALYVGGAAAFLTTKVRESEPGGAIASGAAPGSEGGDLVALSAVAALDDRDHVYGPERGRFVGLALRWFGASLGSDFEFTRIEVDARTYHSLAKRHVLALQGLVTAAWGEPPFWELAFLGGQSVLRGSYEGRYRDRQRLALQAEYRFPLVWRLGGVVHAAAGEVGRDWSDFRFDTIRTSGGAGLRIRLSEAERISLRLDFGVAPGETGVYFAFGDTY